jgi:hypothetical protein
MDGAATAALPARTPARPEPAASRLAAGPCGCGRRGASCALIASMTRSRAKEGGSPRSLTIWTSIFPWLMPPPSTSARRLGLLWRRNLGNRAGSRAAPQRRTSWRGSFRQTTKASGPAPYLNCRASAQFAWTNGQLDTQRVLASALPPPCRHRFRSPGLTAKSGLVVGGLWLGVAGFCHILHVLICPPRIGDAFADTRHTLTEQ